ncbi:hypothetical protein PUN28_000636 [Cardiocondyla obscurior]|uniref:Ribosomal protein S7 n=1 Tax=Cardiocondyla obscurior TaxID=286306 RepID=A0AAW2H0E9_9HYME
MRTGERRRERDCDYRLEYQEKRGIPRCTARARLAARADIGIISMQKMRQSFVNFKLPRVARDNAKSASPRCARICKPNGSPYKNIEEYIHQFLFKTRSKYKAGMYVCISQLMRHRIRDPDYIANKGASSRASKKKVELTTLFPELTFEIITGNSRKRQDTFIFQIAEARIGPFDKFSTF